MPIEKVVPEHQKRKEHDEPDGFIEIYALRDVPFAEVSKVMQTVRKLRSSCIKNNVKTTPPSYLKTVVHGPSYFSNDKTASVLFSTDESDSKSLYVPSGASVSKFFAPDEPPISQTQADYWIEKHHDIWPTTYRPLPKDSVPPEIMTSEELSRHESFMRIAFEQARLSFSHGEVCFSFLISFFFIFFQSFSF